MALGKLGGKKGGPARARNLTSAERSAIASQGAAARWSRKGDSRSGVQSPDESATGALLAGPEFAPLLDILPPGQRALWPRLAEVSRLGFVLYGGTAIALRLGHRQSVDFDFFTEQIFEHDRLLGNLSFLRDALVLQDEPDTLTLRLDGSRPGWAPVKLSFFRVGTGRVGVPTWARDGRVLVASLEDLLAHKLKVLLQRVEKKDYLDVHALLDHGLRLEEGLAGARALFGRAFQPAQALKALTWFQGGDLEELPAGVRKELVTAATRVGDLAAVPRVHPRLGGGEP